ncbi:DUF1684 domain-containing protein [Sphingobium sp.]|uniref:DUF1684 domain-containing protein n=1 Tax=Sphingobium sp. TaxID=1912891 RepID=UPI002635A037|nr:DUF1684 domain-containing protein [Sphingobium sp.]
MALSDDYIRAWQTWHDGRVALINAPYGPLSLISQDWLNEGEYFQSEFIPGKWMQKDGEIYYYPDEDSMARGEFLIVDGKEARAPTHIPHRYEAGEDAENLVPVFFNDLQVESSYTRLNDRGEMINAIRVRDPKEAARKKIDGIEAFPLSEEWIVPARFIPGTGEVSNTQTVESTIFEASYILGEIVATIDGKDYSFEVHGHTGGSRDTGYFMNGIYIVFGDATNGKETYGGGRVIRFGSMEEVENMTQLDFNRASTFNCSVTTFMACTAAPRDSRLPFRVPAGQFAPPVPHERIQTYAG